MTDSPSPELSRRTFAKVAAWSVPVIAVAVASPAAMASGEYDLAITVTGAADSQWVPLERIGLNAFNQIQFSNLGLAPVPDGMLANITYDFSLLRPIELSTLPPSGSPVMTTSAPAVIRLPEIAPGGIFRLNIGWDPQAAALAVGATAITTQIQVLAPSSSADANPGNNMVSATARIFKY